MNTQTQQNNDPTVATKNPFTVFKMIQIFEKIEKGAHAEHFAVLNKELQKIHPTDESEVFFKSAYSPDDNSIGINLYVSKPKTEENAEPMPFGKLMTEYFLRSDINSLGSISKSFVSMELTEGADYDVDLIPLFYDDEADDYYIHFRIMKEAVK